MCVLNVCSSIRTMHTEGKGNPPGPPHRGYVPSSPHYQIGHSGYPTDAGQGQPEIAGRLGITPDTRGNTAQHSQEGRTHTPTHQQAPCVTQKICDAQMHQEHPGAQQIPSTALAQHNTDLDYCSSHSVWGQSRATTFALDRAPGCSRDVHGRSRKTDFGNPGEAQI